jgi:hypothetical protein
VHIKSDRRRGITYRSKRKLIVRARRAGSVGGIVEEIVDVIAGRTRRVLDDETMQARRPFVSRVVRGPLRALAMSRLEPGDVDWFGAEHPGPVVFYVNGMNTPHEDAEEEARRLSQRLRRKVGLIYNPCCGLLRDAVWFAYDRAWPFLLHPLANLTQVNETTRKLTWLLYTRPGKISIVSHSLGVLNVRNALIAAGAFRGRSLRDRLAWVATGVPLRDEEIFPRPARFTALVNADDVVARFVGCRLNPERFTWPNHESHDFLQGYLRQIDSRDVW